MSVVAGLLTGAGTLKKLLELVENLKKIQKWIFVQPREAAAELSRIISEVMKATPAVTQAVDKLLRIIDDAKPSLQALAQVGDGSLLLEIQTIRPHCHEINLIENKYLSQWLALPTTRGPDADELRNFLNQVAHGDMDYFVYLENFATAVQELGDEAYRLTVNGKEQEAMDLLRKAAPHLFDARIAAVKLAQELTQLQNEFRRHALGLPPT
jgi:hypothetical protein